MNGLKGVDKVVYYGWEKGVFDCGRHVWCLGGAVGGL